MIYTEFCCNTDILNDLTKELLTAFLSECGYESFIEEDGKYKAYIQKTGHVSDITDILKHNELLHHIIGHYTITDIPSQDWNTEWESNFSSVQISDTIVIRSPKAEATSAEYEILIDPRMAFGSGTHETTAMILKTLYTIDMKGKRIADCGCGTGILGIFAAKRGAASIFAFDNDDCSVQNSISNYTSNNIQNVTIKHGDLSCMNGMEFDIILANLNRNILIDNLQHIANASAPQGIVLMSGFYTQDIVLIEQAAKPYGFQLLDSKSTNNWSMTIFKHT